ncbi:MAG: hypothetical protein KKG10_09740, partial [Proteobacteria bacterium]|nr:hypothetical protein [Pseudomonadota bacterium]
MKTIFYFDRIRLNSMTDPTELKNSLPVETFKDLSRSFQIDRVNSKGTFQGYRSRIDMTAPTDE